MKSSKLLAITILILLAVVSFFLPYKSYRSWFIFTSDYLTTERIADVFAKQSFFAELFLLVVFTPVAAFGILQTKFEKNLIGLLVVSLISSTMLFFADFGLCFALFEVEAKFLIGYLLFMLLSILGCVAFWIMTLHEIWRRISNRHLNLKTA
jgi:hypothetical protein